MNRSAMEKIKERWLSQAELAELFNVDTRRIQDLKSQGLLNIKSAKLSSKAYYYHVEDVLEYMDKLRKSGSPSSETSTNNEGKRDFGEISNE